MALLHHPTLLVIGINSSLLLLAYLWIFPCYARNDWNQLMTLDCLFCGCSLLICGLLYWGSGEQLGFGSWTTNWFWFALLSYFIIEFPLFIWYYQRFLR